MVSRARLFWRAKNDDDRRMPKRSQFGVQVNTMRKASRKKEPGPSSVKQGRARVPRMNFAQATLTGKWLLEANDVPKHVQSDEMEAFVQEMRRRFYELACDALDVVRYSLEVRKDGRLGHRILVAMGYVGVQETRTQSRHMRRPLARPRWLHMKSPTTKTR
jgi:hypothetical protein